MTAFDPIESARLVAESRRCKWCRGTGRSGPGDCFECLYCQSSRVLPSAIADQLDAAAARIRVLEAERDAIRRQADAATVNLGNARDAHQDELDRGAAIEVRLTERVAELEALVEQLRCGDLVSFADGELPEDRAAAFRDHLTRCRGCQDGLGDLVALDVSLEMAGRPRPWAPQACTNAIACPECGAAPGVRCSTDRPLHTSRWDAWKAVGFPEVAP